MPPLKEIGENTLERTLQWLHQKRFIASALFPRVSRQRDLPLSGAGLTKHRPRTRWEKLKRGKIIPEIHDYLQARLIGKPMTKSMKQMFWFRVKHKNYAPVFMGYLRPQMKLVASAIVEKDLPPPTLPEVR